MKPAYSIFSAALAISIAYAATPAPVKKADAGCSVTKVVATKYIEFHHYTTIATRSAVLKKLNITRISETKPAKIAKIKPVKIKGCKTGRTRKHGVCGRWKT